MARIEPPAQYFADRDGKYLGAFYGSARPPAGSVRVDAPPGPGYRKARMDAYAMQLGKDPGDIIKTLGDVIDATIAQVEAIRAATSTAATPEWSTMLTKIAAIKAANPSS